MISIFPEFKNLDIDDKTEVDRFLNLFLPYSDFNFASIFSYDVNEKSMICWLNDNLVLKFYDYITQKPFITFLGKTKVGETVDELFKYLELHDLPPELKLIPEDVINNLPKEYFTRYDIREDFDNNDYVVSVNELTQMEEGKNHTKKRYMHKFVEFCPDHVVRDLDLKDELVKFEINSLLKKWRIQREKSEEDVKVEFTAIKRLLDHAKFFKLHTYGVYCKGILVGFTINEVVHGGYYMGHFGKADLRYKGLTSYLEFITAQEMKKLGAKYMNFEQDMGIEGLKHSKESWHPDHLLKKFTIKTKDLEFD